MFAHPGPAPPARGTDLIVRAVGAWALAASGSHAAGHAGAPRRRRQAANRPRQTTAEGGRSR
jgi:hypothetical protein